MSTYRPLFSILLFVALLATNQSSVAQSKRLDSPEKYLGVQFGATGSMVNFLPSVKQSYLLGANAGLSFRYIGHSFAGFQTELNYSQRGWSEASGQYNRNLHYIELPFMTHFYFGKKIKIFLNVGPKISYLIAESSSVDQNNPSTLAQHKNSIDNQLDYGFCLGPGFLFRIQKQVFLFDLRANYSLSDVFSNHQRDYFDTSNNMNLSVNLGWQFRIK